MDVLDPVSGRRLVRGGRKFRGWLRANYVWDPLAGEMVYEPSGCRRFGKDPTINPVTKRRINPNGRLAKEFRKQCAQDGFMCPMWQSTGFRKNPLTNRRTEEGKRSWRRLLRMCSDSDRCAAWSTIGKESRINPATGYRTSEKTIRRLDRACPAGNGPRQFWPEPMEKRINRSSCGNTNAAKRIGYALRVAKSTIPGAGRGLFAVEGFRKGDTITEYDGEVIDIREAERRRKLNLDSHIRTLASGRVAIDGRKVPNSIGHGGGSFANDARGPQTNAEFCNSTKVTAGLKRSGTLKAIERTWLRATKDILPGQEIFASYGRGYWKHHS